jgi:four helix bundle protein
MYKAHKTVRTFEDLEVYKIAREFSRSISKLIKTLPKNEEYNLKGQMRRAKLSVTNNIAEGFGRYHYQENIQFCRQSRGSICELIDDFNECYDESYIDEDQCNEYKDEAYRLMRVLNGYIAGIRRTKERNNHV